MENAGKTLKMRAFFAERAKDYAPESVAPGLATPTTKTIESVLDKVRRLSTMYGAVWPSGPAAMAALDSYSAFVREARRLDAQRSELSPTGRILDIRGSASLLRQQLSHDLFLTECGGSEVGREFVLTNARRTGRSMVLLDTAAFYLYEQMDTRPLTAIDLEYAEYRYWGTVHRDAAIRDPSPSWSTRGRSQRRVQPYTKPNKGQPRISALLQRMIDNV